MGIKIEINSKHESNIGIMHPPPLHHPLFLFSKMKWSLHIYVWSFYLSKCLSPLTTPRPHFGHVTQTHDVGWV